MNNQIFYIRGSRGRFAECYEARGYLPALEPDALHIIDYLKVPKLDREAYTRLQAQLLHLQGKIIKQGNRLTEHIEAPKRKKGNNIYIYNSINNKDANEKTMPKE